MVTTTTYEEFLKYFDTLKGVARIPYTKVIDNPPDILCEHRRVFTKDEYEEDQRKFQNIKEMYENR